MNIYFDVGEEVIRASTGEEWVIAGIVTSNIYVDPVYGTECRLDSNELPLYLIEGRVEELRDGSGKSLEAWSGASLRKKYKKGDSFESLMASLKSTEAA